MKKILFILMFFIPLLQANGQYGKYFDLPTIYQIDNLESAKTNYGHDDLWLKNFYASLENGTAYSEFADNYSKALRTFLVKDNLTFITNGWLYVFSYEPILSAPEGKSRNIGDYNRENFKVVNQKERRVYLYRKNTRSANSTWELASYNEISTHSIPYGINVDVYAFNPEEPLAGVNVLKSPAFEHVVFVLYGITSSYNSHVTQTNQFIILTPTQEYNNGSIDYMFDKYLGIDKFPVRITGTIDEGKTIQTIDNLGGTSVFYTKTGRDSNGKSGHISFTGDFGFGGYTGK
jgi:hypothetical protein